MKFPQTLVRLSFLSLTVHTMALWNHSSVTSSLFSMLFLVLNDGKAIGTDRGKHLPAPRFSLALWFCWCWWPINVRHTLIPRQTRIMRMDSDWCRGDLSCTRIYGHCRQSCFVVMQFYNEVSCHRYCIAAWCSSFSIIQFYLTRDEWRDRFLDIPVWGRQFCSDDLVWLSSLCSYHKLI